nr:PREDICTED: 60S ribosomal protein L28-like [Rhinolophus sinicus]
MNGHVQVLQLPDPKEQAEVQQEPNDVKPRDSFSYNGLIHRKTEGVEPAGVGKGAVVVMSGDPASKSRPAPTGDHHQQQRPGTRSARTMSGDLRKAAIQS